MPTRQIKKLAAPLLLASAAGLAGCQTDGSSTIDSPVDRVFGPRTEYYMPSESPGMTVPPQQAPALPAPGTAPAPPSTLLQPSVPDRGGPPPPDLPTEARRGPLLRSSFEASPPRGYQPVELRPPVLTYQDYVSGRFADIVSPPPYQDLNVVSGQTSTEPYRR